MSVGRMAGVTDWWVDRLDGQRDEQITADHTCWAQALKSALYVFLLSPESLHSAADIWYPFD